MPATPVVYLVDGSSQMYRAYHAPIRTAEGTLLRNAAGRPTNAVYIFVTMLRKLLKDHSPEYIVASFDLPGRYRFLADLTNNKWFRNNPCLYFWDQRSHRDKSDSFLKVAGLLKPVVL